MKKTFLLISIAAISVLLLSGCGGSSEKPEGKPDTKAAKTPGGDRSDKAEGEDVAKEILAIFDKAVEEVTPLVKEKPAVADVKPKIEEILKAYTLKMQELNKKYLALKTKDIALFGAANSYLGEHRGKHVFAKDQKLDAIIYHYQQQEDKSVHQLLKSGLIDLLETAVKR